VEFQGVSVSALTLLSGGRALGPPGADLPPSGPRPGNLETTEEEHMKIRPLQDRVIVRRVKEEEKTKGGIIIPDTAKEKPIEGVILAVGNGKVLEDGTVRKLDVKEGDKVLFGKYSGTEVKIDGEEALILREDDILGVIEK
jgi:chaperonin GroES